MTHRPSRRRTTAIALTALVAGFAGAPAVAAPQAALAPDDDFEADVRIFNDHIVTLANPFMEGRVPGSRGMEIAKEYFEHYLKEAGVGPGFADGTSYRQPFPLGSTVEITGQSISVNADGRITSFAPESDQIASSMGASGSASGEVVFVGYSIETGPDDYSNYGEDDDLSGKIAVMYRSAPLDEDGESLWSAMDARRYGRMSQKVNAAVNHGAAGVIIVNTPGSVDPRANELRSGSSRNPADVPVMMMSADAGSRLLKAASGGDRTAMELRQHADGGGGVVELGGNVNMSAEINREPLMAENVGGLLPGRGRLKDEYIVIGAHLDHLGMGYFGSRSGPGELHPGADDNASGSAAVLMLADKLVDDYAELPGDANLRSILFVGFSAEESGLNGSRYYVENPIVPIEDHDFMINFDMIGRIKNGRLNITGSNSAGGFEEWLDPFYENTELDVVKTDNFSRGGSDHGPFRSKNVPFLFGIIADFHADYHTPADVSWKINREDSVRTVYLFRDIALAGAQRSEPLIFASEDAQAANQPPPAPRGGARVRIGIEPSYDPSVEGILLGGVPSDGPAGRAGLRAGDIMKSWNDNELKSIEDLMPYLGRAKPGDVISVGILRDDAKMVIKVTLEAAGG